MPDATEIKVVVDTSGQEGVDRIVGSLAHLEKALLSAGGAEKKHGEAMHAAGKEADELGEKISKFGDQVAVHIENPVEAARRSLTRLLDSMGPVGAGAGAAVGVFAALGAAAYESAEKLGAFATQLTNTSIRMGLTTTEVQQFSFAAKLSGSEIGSLEMSMRILSRSLSDSGEEGKKAKEAMRAHGIEARNLFGEMKPMSQMFLEIGDALRSMTSAQEQTAFAMQVMGREGSQNIPMLLNLRKNLEAAGDIDIVTSKQIEEMEEMHLRVAKAEDDWAKLSSAIETVAGKTFVVTTEFVERVVKASNIPGVPAAVQATNIPGQLHLAWEAGKDLLGNLLTADDKGEFGQPLEGAYQGDADVRKANAAARKQHDDAIRTAEALKASARNNAATVAWQKRGRGDPNAEADYNRFTKEQDADFATFKAEQDQILKSKLDQLPLGGTNFGKFQGQYDPGVTVFDPDRDLAFKRNAAVLSQTGGGKEGAEAAVKTAEEAAKQATDKLNDVQGTLTGPKDPDTGLPTRVGGAVESVAGPLRAAKIKADRDLATAKATLKAITDAEEAYKRAQEAAKRMREELAKPDTQGLIGGDRLEADLAAKLAKDENDAAGLRGQELIDNQQVAAQQSAKNAVEVAQKRDEDARKQKDQLDKAEASAAEKAETAAGKRQAELAKLDVPTDPTQRMAEAPARIRAAQQAAIMAAEKRRDDAIAAAKVQRANAESLLNPLTGDALNQADFEQTKATNQAKDTFKQETFDAETAAQLELGKNRNETNEAAAKLKDSLDKIHEGTARDDLMRQSSRAQRVSELTVPLGSGSEGQEAAANDAYKIRLDLAQKIRDLDLAHAENVKDTAEKTLDVEKAKADYIKESQDAELDRAMKLLEIDQKRNADARSLAGDVFGAMTSGKDPAAAMRELWIGQVKQVGSSVFSNMFTPMFKPLTTIFDQMKGIGAAPAGTGNLTDLTDVASETVLAHGPKWGLGGLPVAGGRMSTLSDMTLAGGADTYSASGGNAALDSLPVAGRGAFSAMALGSAGDVHSPEVIAEDANTAALIALTKALTYTATGGASGALPGGASVPVGITSGLPGVNSLGTLTAPNIRALEAGLGAIPGGTSGEGGSYSTGGGGFGGPLSAPNSPASSGNFGYAYTGGQGALLSGGGSYSSYFGGAGGGSLAEPFAQTGAFEASGQGPILVAAGGGNFGDGSATWSTTGTAYANASDLNPAGLGFAGASEVPGGMPSWAGLGIGGPPADTSAADAAAVQSAADGSAPASSATSSTMSPAAKTAAAITSTMASLQQKVKGIFEGPAMKSFSTASAGFGAGLSSVVKGKGFSTLMNGINGPSDTPGAGMWSSPMIPNIGDVGGDTTALTDDSDLNPAGLDMGGTSMPGGMGPAGLGIGSAPGSMANTASEIGAGVGIAGAAYLGTMNAIRGFSQGGARGDLTGAGAILGVAATIPGPQQPFVMAGAAILQVITALMGDPRANRAASISHELTNDQYNSTGYIDSHGNFVAGAQPKSISYFGASGGGSYDTNFMGGIRGGSFAGTTRNTYDPSNVANQLRNGTLAQPGGRTDSSYGYGDQAYTGPTVAPATGTATAAIVPKAPSIATAAPPLQIVVHTMDAKSFMDNAPNIATAVRKAVQMGHPLVQELSQALNPR